MYSYIVVFLVLFLVIWLFLGYRNYKDVLDTVHYYDDIIKNLEEAKKKEEDTFHKAFLFNEKEDMINANLHLEELRMSLLENEKKFKRSMLFSFLVLGPLFKLK